MIRFNGKGPVKILFSRFKLPNEAMAQSAVGKGADIVRRKLNCMIEIGKTFFDESQTMKTNTPVAEGI